MAEFGITESGFSKKTLSDILSKLNEDTTGVFGAVNTEADAVFGQYNGIISEIASEVWDLAELVYGSQYPASAKGVSLDSVIDLNNLKRLGETSSVVEVLLEGSEGTIVPEDTLLRQDETNEIFETSIETEITKANAVQIVISVNDVNDTPHTIDIDSNNYSSSLTSNEADILNDLAAQIQADSLQTATVLNDLLTITAVDNETDFSLVEGSSLTLEEIWTPTIASAQNTGPIPVPINSIIIIESPVSGLNAVKNLIVGTTGRAVETDDQFRIRRKQSLRVIGAATDPAIEARLVEEVPNVTAAIVKSNRTSVVDSEGRPPKSFEAIVTYPVGDTETEQLIADKLWEIMPSGIEAHGSISKVIIDSTGDSQVVKFSRPTDVAITVELDFDADDEEALAVDYDNAIKQEIVDFANGTGNYINPEQTVGKDVLVQRYFNPIYKIQGVGVITRLEMKTPTGSLTPTFIEILSTEKAVFDTTNITVSLNP